MPTVGRAAFDSFIDGTSPAGPLPGEALMYGTWSNDEVVAAEVEEVAIDVDDPMTGRDMAKKEGVEGGAVLVCTGTLNVGAAVPVIGGNAREVSEVDAEALPRAQGDKGGVAIDDGVDPGVEVTKVEEGLRAAVFERGGIEGAGGLFLAIETPEIVIAFSGVDGGVPASALGGVDALEARRLGPGGPAIAGSHDVTPISGRFQAARERTGGAFRPQQRLNLILLPQGQSALRGVCGAGSSLCFGDECDEL